MSDSESSSDSEYEVELPDSYDPFDPQQMENLTLAERSSWKLLSKLIFFYFKCNKFIQDAKNIILKTRSITFFVLEICGIKERC